MCASSLYLCKYRGKTNPMWTEITTKVNEGDRRDARKPINVELYILLTKEKTRVAL